MDRTQAMDLIGHHATLRTTPALVQTVSDLVASGQLAAGDRLPTVRDLADQLGMSRSAVGQAWHELSLRGLIETRRRGGTLVLGKEAPPRAKRFESMLRSTAAARDLGNLRLTDHPFPDLARALQASLRQPKLHAYAAGPITDELIAAVRPTWPFETGSFLTTHGAMDAMGLALSAIVKPGDPVIVEDPTPGRVLDLLDARGVTPLPVAYQSDGPDLTTLRRALISKPVAFVYQPSGSAPCGRSISARWVDEAASVLPQTMSVVEFSQVPSLYPDGLSLGGRLPGQVAHIRGYNIHLGPDMGVAVVGGNPALLEAMWLRLSYSTPFVSRILQGALAHLLTDDRAQRAIALTTEEMRRRHRHLVTALERHGFRVERTNGPGVWLEVPDEYSVCAWLSRHGIAVYPGHYFTIRPNREQRIHINSAAIANDAEEVAALLAQACKSPSPEFQS